MGRAVTKGHMAQQVQTASTDELNRMLLARQARLVEIQLEEKEAELAKTRDRQARAAQNLAAMKKSALEQQAQRKAEQEACERTSHHKRKDGVSNISGQWSSTDNNILKLFCAKCASEWSGTRQELRKQLGDAYPDESMLGGLIPGS